jgi:hypothetical protein
MNLQFAISNLQLTKADSKVSSSIGRASVSKTEGWGFESLLTCQERQASGLRPQASEEIELIPETSPEAWALGPKACESER